MLFIITDVACSSGERKEIVQIFEDNADILKLGHVLAISSSCRQEPGQGKYSQQVKEDFGEHGTIILRPKQIVEVVRHAGSQPSERFHLAGLTILVVADG